MSREIVKSLSELLDEYGDLFGDADFWSGRIASYAKKLTRYPPHVVKQACQQASDRYPNKFPTLGQLSSICRAIDEKRIHEDREAAEAERRATSQQENHDRTMELRGRIPDDRAGQEGYIGAGSGPFERLARSWEVQSKINNLAPNQKTPPELHRSRMGQFWRCWDEVAKNPYRAPLEVPARQLPPGPDLPDFNNEREDDDYPF